MTERSSHPNMALVSLCAGLFGAVVALLIAPRSGKETRADLRHGADDLKRQATQTWEEARSQVERGLDKAKSVSERLTAKTRQKAEEAGEDLDRMQQERKSEPGHIQSPVLSKWEEEI